MHRRQFTGALLAVPWLAQAQSDALGARLRAALKGIPAGTLEVWVTHQVNMTALTGEGMAMGEALVLDVTGTVVARNTFS
jgi:hypothetical protein